ncbi:type III-B CRISPR module-associated protein Cmr3 [Paenibacillus amylolyticus]|uniref:Type III-B CRISPR module-associated protein Cmr3 n=1 Tax=Paenibacillus amylolyticus TaxID=1451 RepID=A0ABD8B2G6_PAEAM
MNKWLKAQPIDPIMIRDGRPFNAIPGIRAHTLSDVTPSVMAGTIRTMLAKQRQAQHGKSSPLDYYAKLPVRGPLYHWQASLYFPMPRDAEVYEDNGLIGLHKVMPCDPDSDTLKEEGQGFFGVGTEGRLHNQLWPPLGAGLHKEMKKAPAYVSAHWMKDWLTDEVPSKEIAKDIAVWQREVEIRKNEPSLYNADGDPASQKAPSFLQAFERQERTHISIDEERQVAKDQHLYSTESLVFPDGLSLHSSVTLPANEPGWTGDLSELHTMGGERRLVHFSEVPAAESLWQCPEEITDALQGAKYIRMVLATPAFFRKGWQPGWLNEHLESKDLYDTGVKLRLLWACVPRWQPVSGWSYAHGRKGTNEKAVRRLVPAGSVYFFKVIEGSAATLAEKMWLQSVSDANRRKGAFDQEDGFGLALWGKWTPDTEQDIDKRRSE